MKSRSSVRFASIEFTNASASQHLYNDELQQLWYQKTELDLIKNAAKYEVIRFKRNCISGQHHQDVSIRGLEYGTSKDRQKKLNATIKYIVASQSILRNSNTSDITFQLANISSKLTNYAKCRAINDAALDTLSIYNSFEGFVENSHSMIKCIDYNPTLRNRQLKRNPLKLTEIDGFSNNIDDRPMKRSNAA